MTEELVSDYGLSFARACRLTGLARSQFYYRSRKDDTEVIEALQDLAATHPTYGFRKLMAYLKRADRAWNHKRVYRVYKLLKLNKKRRGKRRLPARMKEPLVKQEELNLGWSMDFILYSLASGSKFRTLEQFIDWRGKPAAIRVYNGPEFTSAAFSGWCQHKEIVVQYTQPGKPMQNGFIEHFNGSYRREVEDAYLSLELEEVRYLAESYGKQFPCFVPYKRACFQI